MKKERFTVGGSPALKRAFARELVEAGLEEFTSNYHYKTMDILIAAHNNPKVFGYSFGTPKYTLPQDWEEAKKAALEFYAEPKKVLPEIGKWYYNGNGQTLFLVISDSSRVGFIADGEWSTGIGKGFDSTLTEATDKQVEEALIKEAIKRGLVDGCTFTSFSSGEDWTVSGDIKYEYELKTNTLLIRMNRGETKADGYVDRTRCSLTIFRKGEWVTIVEQPKEPTVGDYVLLKANGNGLKNDEVVKLLELNENMKPTGHISGDFMFMYNSKYYRTRKESIIRLATEEEINALTTMPEIEVDGYTAEFNDKNSVSFGCQTIQATEIKSLVEALKLFNSGSHREITGVNLRGNVHVDMDTLIEINDYLQS